MNVKQPAIRSRPVKIRFDKGYGWRAKIGFVLIATDRIIEREMFRLAPEGVGVYFTRLQVKIVLPSKRWRQWKKV